MATNPNPARITDAMWWLWEELHTLEPTSELGGIYANKPGYHNTRNANSTLNYSVTDTEDKGGPGDKAAAIDWTFPEAQRASYDRIMKYSERLLTSGLDLNDPRMNGWREFYGQADKDTHVEGWDFRYVRAATSDPSHLWHIHLSEDRDKVESYDNKNNLLSVLRGETVEQWRSAANPQEDDMPDTECLHLPRTVGEAIGVPTVPVESGGLPWGAVHMRLKTDHGIATYRIWYQLDGEGYWRPLTGDGTNGYVRVKPEDPADLHHFQLPKGTGAMTFTLVALEGTDPDGPSQFWGAARFEIDKR